MNNNLFNNLQALSFLSSVDTIFQNQLLQNKLNLLPTNSSHTPLALPQLLPRMNNQLPMDFAMLSRLAEAAKQQELMQQAYQANLQAELMKVQLLKMKQFDSNTHKDLVAPVVRQVAPEHKEKLPESVKTYSKSKNEPEMSLEANIKQILNFLIKNFGHINQKDLARERQKYEYDECLIQVFDALVSKYASTTKTKEEMIKYVLRKALRSIRDKLKEGTKRSEKEVSKIFYQKYFNGGLSEQEANIENEDDLMKLLLPFKKTSKDKTMNSTFLSKIFGSEEFCADYNNYLLEFDAEADFDNSAKIKRFISYIATCVKSKKISNILNYKRVPWLKIWITNSKSIGDQLIKEKSIPTKGKKKSKGDANTASSVDTYDSDCKVESFSTPESN